MLAREFGDVPSPLELWNFLLAGGDHAFEVLREVRFADRKVREDAAVKAQLLALPASTPAAADEMARKCNTLYCIAE